MYVLSRTNKELVYNALKLMNKGESVCIEHIASYIEEQIRSASNPNFANKNLTHEITCLKKLGIKTNFNSTMMEIILDVVANDSILPTKFKINQLESLLEYGTAIEKSDYILMTVHKSKGLTLPNVFFVTNISEEAITLTGSVEFCNIVYTAMTRSKGYFSISKSTSKQLDKITPHLFKLNQGVMQ